MSTCLPALDGPPDDPESFTFYLYGHGLQSRRSHDSSTLPPPVWAAARTARPRAGSTTGESYTTRAERVTIFASAMTQYTRRRSKHDTAPAPMPLLSLSAAFTEKNTSPRTKSNPKPSPLSAIRSKPRAPPRSFASHSALASLRRHAQRGASTLNTHAPQPRSVRSSVLTTDGSRCVAPALIHSRSRLQISARTPPLPPRPRPRTHLSRSWP